MMCLSCIKSINGISLILGQNPNSVMVCRVLFDLASAFLPRTFQHNQPFALLSLFKGAMFLCPPGHCTTVSLTGNLCPPPISPPSHSFTWLLLLYILAFIRQKLIIVPLIMYLSPYIIIHRKIEQFIILFTITFPAPTQVLVTFKVINNYQRNPFVPHGGILSNLSDLEQLYFTNFDIAYF